MCLNANISHRLYQLTTVFDVPNKHLKSRVTENTLAELCSKELDYNSGKKIKEKYKHEIHSPLHCVVLCKQHGCWSSLSAVLFEHEIIEK